MEPDQKRVRVDEAPVAAAAAAEAAAPPVTPAPSVGEVDEATGLPRTFVESVRKAASDLNEHGYAIVPDVVSEDDCDEVWEMMWDFIERTSNNRVDRNKPETWKKEWPQALHWILKNYNVGQAKPCWMIRTVPRVIAVFALLYGTDRLYCSYDGMAMIPDAKKMNAASGGGDKDHLNEAKDGWLHADQNPNAARYRLCIQAWVTVREVNEGAATLVVIPGSHKKLKKFKKFVPKTKTGGYDNNHWFKPTPAQIASVFGKNWKEKRVRIKAPKGGMALWDSRTFHSGGVPVAGHPGAVKERGVLYVCMAPSKQCDADRRKELALTNRTTAHWPQFMKPNGQHPRTYGQPMPPHTDLDTEREDLCKEKPEIADTIRTLTGEKRFGNTGLLGWVERSLFVHKPEGAIVAPEPFLTMFNPLEVMDTIRAKQRVKTRKRKAKAAAAAAAAGSDSDSDYDSE